MAEVARGECRSVGAGAGEGEERWWCAGSDRERSSAEQSKNKSKSNPTEKKTSVLATRGPLRFDSIRFLYDCDGETGTVMRRLLGAGC
jgi:hypothetical protein